MTGAPTMRGLLAARADDARVGLRAGDERWAWAEVVAQARRRVGWIASHRGRAEQAHVGVLLDNTPEYAFMLLGAALSGDVVVGLNPTRVGAALARDIAHTACDVLVTSRAAAAALRDEDPGVPVCHVDDDAWSAGLDAAPEAPALPDDPARSYVLILTSGTTSAPKAVVCSSGKIASQGSVIPHLVGLGPDDTTYLAMPLFHSNAIIAGLAPTLAVGATLALAERFSASAFLPDVRRYGATYANYVGTPLSYVLAQPARPDDADNPLRVLFGNEAAPSDITRFAARFGCRVIDAYGSTEGGISILRTDQTPPAALGVAIGDVRVLDADGRECAVAELDADGWLRNPDEAIGELVNLDGRGAFEGYFGDADAEAARVRDGRYHSGDLGYRDAAGFLYFAGRTDDWLRVGGENFAAAPVQRVLARHPEVIEAVVLGVPDATAGDQVLAVLVTPDGLDAAGLRAWLDTQPDLSPRWRPRYVRAVADLPRTGTGKVRRLEVRAQAWLPEGTWLLDGTSYRPMTEADRDGIRAAFAAAGRLHAYPGGSA